MKRLFFVIVIALIQSTVAHAYATDAESFLLQNYGWTIDFSKQEKKWFDFSWQLDCSSVKPVLPKEGANVFIGTPCLQQDKAYYTAILWRVPSVKSIAVEKMVYDRMSGGLGYGKVTCTEEAFPSAVAEKGIIRDCEVPLQHGTFFVSFYHFDVPMPAGGSFVSNEGKKAEALDFTIWVQNADSVGHVVKDKFRELISLIRQTK